MNLGVIPGRLNSNRFPRKIIYPLNGKAIIEHVYDNAKESKYLDKLIINPISPKANIPKNIVARVIVNTNLSCFVILCSSLII